MTLLLFNESSSKKKPQYVSHRVIVWDTIHTLIFDDMTHYSMVKTTFFNGIKHPSIVFYDPAKDEVRVVRTFGYEDYRNKLS